MNQSQRAAAERLADALNEGYAYAMDEAAALLRELLAEQWLTSAKLDACMASRDALRDWAQECRDQVLYLLAQRDDELGRLADGFGQASVALMRELLAEPVINQQMTTELAEPVQEPVAWIQPDHLQKARVAPFLCRVEPTKRMSDFVPLYAHPQQRLPLSEFQRMRIIGDEFPLALVQPIVIQKIDSVCRAVEAAHGIKEAP